MREIKFRAWDIINEKFVELNFLNFENNEIILVGANGWEYDVDNVEINEFAGLKDKNGKEIYEGDIIKISLWKYAKEYFKPKGKKSEHEGIFLVEIGESIWGDQFNFKNISGYPCSTHLSPGRNGEIKVIGNIYENPELLNDNKNIKEESE